MGRDDVNFLIGTVGGLIIGAVLMTAILDTLDNNKIEALGNAICEEEHGTKFLRYDSEDKTVVCEEWVDKTVYDGLTVRLE